MGKQTFRYCRYGAKWIGLTFAVAGVFLFIIQFLPTYTGRGMVFWLFIGGGIIWGLDTLWSTLDNVKEIADEIYKNRRH